MLIQCRECGKTVSDKASACPHCGAPVSVSEANPLSEKNVPVAGPKIESGKIVYPEDCVIPESVPVRSPVSRGGPDFFAGFLKIFRFLSFLAGLCIILFALFFLLLKINPGNLCGALRGVAESEEPEQVSSARVFFKNTLLSMVDAAEGRSARTGRTGNVDSGVPSTPKKSNLPEVLKKVPSGDIPETLPPPPLPRTEEIPGPDSDK